LTANSTSSVSSVLRGAGACAEALGRFDARDLAVAVTGVHDRLARRPDEATTPSVLDSSLTGG
jgi:hypothetical protein